MKESNRGFTLLEVCVSITIVTFVLLSFIYVIGEYNKIKSKIIIENNIACSVNDIYNKVMANHEVYHGLNSFFLDEEGRITDKITSSYLNVLEEKDRFTFYLVIDGVTRSFPLYKDYELERFYVEIDE